MPERNRSGAAELPPALVMNTFYTGLGIARSLGERGVPVIALSNRRGGYGNFTHFARCVVCPDSRNEPKALLEFMLALGRKLPRRGVIFPTRDDDLVFLNRFRAGLDPYFSLVIAEAPALRACLDKWETSLWAERAGVASPKTWMIDKAEDAEAVAQEVSYPCVLKPVSAHDWRQGGNWELVGARKAIAVESKGELLQEYETVAQADERALVQEMVPGGDENLVIAACYLDRQSRWVAGFNTRKLVQVPEGTGTGCIVEGVERPELFEPARRILEAMGFSGIAEVEFKWDTRDRQYKLIEVNPRPWDQHRLGADCGVDLMYLAYCERAGLPVPRPGDPEPRSKWIAEDTMITTALRLAWHRDPRLWSLFRQARGKRIYAIWSGKDPLPFLAYLFMDLIPGLLTGGVRSLMGKCKRRFWPADHSKEGGLAYGSGCEKDAGRS